MDVTDWDTLSDLPHHTTGWQKDLPLALGPVLGHVTTDTIRVWARAREPGARLLVRFAPAAPGATFDPKTGVFQPLALAGPVRELPLPPGDPHYHTAVVTLTGLDPDTRYFYEIIDADAPRPEGALLTAAPPSFRTLPARELTEDQGGLRFAFLSCNGVQARPPGKTATAMWRRLCVQALRDERVRFAIMAGDQIYADAIREGWLADNSRSHKLDPAATEALYRRLLPEYGRIYLAWWRRAAIRTLMAHLPSVMTWDDHEIYDGWGSFGDEHLPAQQAFFRAAAAAFDAHQLALAPPGHGLARGEGHRAFHFCVGRVGFLVLDLRTNRRARTMATSALLGDAQWAYVQEALDTFASDGVHQLVVVTSVPPVYADRWLLGLPKAILRDSHDDFVDQWASPPNRSDQLLLLGKLFRFRARTGANVIVLGGDVHLGCVGRITSEAPEFLFRGESSATLHQAVSSAIAYHPPAGMLGSLVAMHVDGDHPISRTFRGTIDATHLDRNFAIVSAVAQKRAFWFDLHVEEQLPPVVYHFEGPPGA